LRTARAAISSRCRIASTPCDLSRKFGSHKVKDYAPWRKGYNDHEKARQAAGITNGRVFRRAEDPNDILILQDVADVAQARTWLGGDELKASMTKAGVIGSPNVRFAS
jgi:hypothetical protein